jgi:hypothetical protein
MPVSFVRAATSASVLTGANDSFLVDCTGGSLLVYWLPGVFVTAPSGISVTYNGIAMTAMPSASPLHGANSAYVIGYYMLNPPAGSHTLSASWTNSAAAAKGVAQVFSGAGIPAGNASGSNSTSVAVTTGAAEMALVAWANQNGTSDTVSSGTTDMTGSSGSQGFGAGHKPGLSASIGTGVTEDAMYGINIPALPPMSGFNMPMLGM